MTLRYGVSPSIARPDTDEWQKVNLEFTAPKWGAFINIVFIADACTAYMDDFYLEPIDKAQAAIK